LSESIDAFFCQTLKPKAVKCRSLTFRRFSKHEKKIEWKKVLATKYSSFDPLLTIRGEAIKFIGDDNPPMFKYLGLYLQFDLKQNLVSENIEQKLKDWLRVIDSSLLEGRMKAWLVNFYICSKLSWWLMVQDFSKSVIESWHNLIHSFYRKWLGLAVPAEPSVLYRTNEHFGLNFKDLVQVQRQLKVVKWHIVKHSKDPQTRQLFQHRLKLDMKGQTGKGHALSPCMQIESLERSVEFDLILGSAQQGRTGIGYLRSKREQTPWLSWGLDTMMRKDLSWRAILHDYSQRLLKFLLNAQSNTLPSPDNLRRWNLKKNVPCGLCGFKEATLSHILAGCHWVRNSENKLDREDRYTWRHNNLISHFAKVLRDHLSKNRSVKKLNQKLITFVPEGYKAK